MRLQWRLLLIDVHSLPRAPRLPAAGLLAPTSGDARVHGHSVVHDMAAVRGSLGVCPQFDVLWPEISVREHLQLYAAIKGFPRCGRKKRSLDGYRLLHRRNWF